MRVSSLDDARWPHALDLLMSGSTSIELGDLARLSWRQSVPPDDFVRVAILSDTDPRFLTRTKAEQLVNEGLDLIDSARRAHPELDSLMMEQPVQAELVYDYGMGSVLIARIKDDRSILWEDGLDGGKPNRSEDSS